MESYEYIYDNFAISPHIQVEVFKESNFLNSIHMGNDNYPKVHACRNYISIMSRGSWSAILSTGGEMHSKGNKNMMEWRLHITDKASDAFASKSTWTMKTTLGSKVTVQPQISHNSITIYKRLLQRRCTDSVDIDDRSSSFLLRR